MIEKLFEQLIALGLLKELTLTEVLEQADGAIIITAEYLFRSKSSSRLSVQEITLDFQTKDELALLQFVPKLDTRFFISLA